MAGNQTEADFVQRGAGRPQRKRMASRDKVIMELAAQFQDGHLECEDPWYSCPKSPEGCANDGQGDECNCGADYRAAKLKELLQLAWDAARAEPAPAQSRSGSVAGARRAAPRPALQGQLSHAR